MHWDFFSFCLFSWGKVTIKKMCSITTETSVDWTLAFFFFVANVRVTASKTAETETAPMATLLPNPKSNPKIGHVITFAGIGRTPAILLLSLVGSERDSGDFGHAFLYS